MYSIRGNYKRYTLAQKKQALQLAMETTVMNASKELKIPHASILNWKRKYATANSVMETKKMTGLSLRYDNETDLKIRDWVLRQREGNFVVTRASLTEYAKRVIKTTGFKATDGWLRHFLKRHNLSLRSQTTVAHLPNDANQKIEVFHRHLTELRLLSPFQHIINMDETSMYFDLVPTRTITQKGQRTVAVRTTGAEKCHLTVVLAVTAAGSTLPPLVIFKGKRWPADIKRVPEGINVKMNASSWMTEEVMLSWLSEMVHTYTTGAPTLLVLDSFAGHVSAKVRQRMTELCITPAVIPGGCTFKVQPLDVSLNKPFKDRVRSSWMRYMETTPAVNGRVPTASRQTLLQWVESAWTTIGENPDMIVKSFQTCGILPAIEEANAELSRREETLRSTLLSDDSNSTEFWGFSAADIDRAHLDSEDNNPFVL